MRIPRFSHRNGGRSPYGIVGSELAGALAIASQMALLCPPGFDEWVRRELAGDAEDRSEGRLASAAERQ